MIELDKLNVPRCKRPIFFQKWVLQGPKMGVTDQKIEPIALIRKSGKMGVTGNSGKMF